MSSEEPITPAEAVPPRPEEDVADATAVEDPDGAAEAALAQAEAALKEPTPDELAELRDRAAQADEYLGLAQRAKADFENYRKRAAREAALAETRGVGKLAKELFGALDNLDRALAAADAGAVEPEFVKGMRLIQDELASALSRTGVEGYSPQGEAFDPMQHEAMVQQPVEGAESGTIVEVYQQGYRLADVVLRPARVVVAA